MLIIVTYQETKIYDSNAQIMIMETGELSINSESFELEIEQLIKELLEHSSLEHEAGRSIDTVKDIEAALPGRKNRTIEYSDTVDTDEPR